MVGEIRIDEHPGSRRQVMRRFLLRSEIVNRSAISGEDRIAACEARTVEEHVREELSWLVRACLTYEPALFPPPYSSTPT